MRPAQSWCTHSLIFETPRHQLAGRSQRWVEHPMIGMPAAPYRAANEKGGTMPKHSKESAQPMDMGALGVEWRADLDGYVIEFVTVSQDVDLTPLLQGLPNDQCPSP